MQQIQARIRLLILYLLISLPLIVYGAVRALEASNNSPIDWVDERFAERQVYDHFSEQFGPGDAVVISWPECWWTDPRLDAAVQRLRPDAEFSDAEGNSYFHSVACGRETLLALTGQQLATSGTPVGAIEVGAGNPSESSEAAVEADAGGLFSPAMMQLTETQAVQRLQGLLIGKDGRLTSVIVTLNSAGLALRAKLVPRICEVDMPADVAAMRLVSASYALIRSSCASIDDCTLLRRPIACSSCCDTASTCCSAACNSGDLSSSASTFGSMIFLKRAAISCAPGQSMFLMNRSPATCHNCGLVWRMLAIASTASWRLVR